MDNGSNMDTMLQSLLGGKDISEAAQNAAEQAQPPVFELNLPTHRMYASLTITPAFTGQVVTPESILEYLSQLGITFGIQEGDIREYCRVANFSQPLVCAVGQERKDEEDGKIQYHFDTEKVLKPAERSDGSLDFRELGLVKNIAKGELLCTIIPPSAGQDGMDVMGQVVPHRAGVVPNLPVGTNTEISEDGLSLRSLVDGSIEMLPGSLNINEVYVVRGDVGPISGNISANCSVLVQGDVKSSFFVKATGDITIRGIVEHATLEAGGNIVLSNGMNGGGKGLLRAGGNISGKFFENTVLEAGHDIYANNIMISSIRAEGSLILNGTLGTLVGGECRVGRSVFAKNIGNPAGSVTRIMIDSKDLNALLTKNSKKLADPESITQQVEKTKQELLEFDHNYEILSEQFVQKHPPDGGPSFQMIQAAAQQKKQQFEALIKELESKLKDSKQSLQSFLDFYVIAQGIIYPGVKLAISSRTYNVVKETSNAKFYLGFDGIVWGPVLPSDVPDPRR